MSEHKFRYLLPPGNNFNFVSKFRPMMIISIILMLGCVAALFVNKEVRGSYMNWTIDFKGGTEIILAFKDKTSGAYTRVDTGKVREAVAKSGEDGFDVSDISWTASDAAGNDVKVEGTVIRSPRFSALTSADAQKASAAFLEAFKDRDVQKATWSGDRLSVRSKKHITHAEAKQVLAAQKLELKDWTDQELDQYAHADEGTGEFNQWYAVYGIDRQYETLLEQAFPNVDVNVAQSYGVGAKAGSKLRNDAVKSIVYAIFLIMLYLAFRFDVRYAPGAAFATIHDAVMVIGVFAVTWTEVSLTSVAGLLTVMGFSVNDTVVVFDRIRENQSKLKDKSLDRIVNISLNEMLVRSILTSVTVFATTLIMNIFGTGLVQNFAFAMNVGVIVGVFSSIYLAVPWFLWISKKWYSGPPSARRRAAMAAASPQAAAGSVDAPPEE
ncbi:MAG: protein translocase subunit SecF [Deltaproteobacteria bacterium]|nr:protein translocase subunit SecF [Deltaproteobacteria bacterium]MDQ3300051.1 protein translocase subunit SecF [Myxococcota bacterium]